MHQKDKAKNTLNIQKIITTRTLFWAGPVSEWD